MKPEEIKAECVKIQSGLVVGKARLNELRKLCTHKNTFEAYYSWRVGNISPALMCSDCGDFIKYLEVTPENEFPKCKVPIEGEPFKDNK